MTYAKMIDYYADFEEPILTIFDKCDHGVFVDHDCAECYAIEIDYTAQLMAQIRSGALSINEKLSNGNWRVNLTMDEWISQQTQQDDL